jgi:hypothetical protein
VRDRDPSERNGCTNGSMGVALIPNAGQTVINRNPSVSYAISLVFGEYGASTQTIGGTFSAAIQGWVIADAVDVEGADSSSRGRLERPIAYREGVYLP